MRKTGRRCIFRFDGRVIKMSDIYTVKITRQAEEQLKEIRNYIAEELKVPDTAKDWLRGMSEKIKLLDHSPSRVKLVDDEPWRSEGIRRMPVKNFYVYFWIDEGNKIVQVIGVVYQKREQKRQLKQLRESGLSEEGVPFWAKKRPEG